MFVRNEEGTFDRFEENHYQHGFFDEEVTGAAQEAGLKLVAVYDAFGHEAPMDSSERLYYIFKK